MLEMPEYSFTMKYFPDLANEILELQKKVGPEK